MELYWNKTVGAFVLKAILALIVKY